MDVLEECLLIIDKENYDRLYPLVEYIYTKSFEFNFPLLKKISKEIRRPGTKVSQMLYAESHFYPIVTLAENNNLTLEQVQKLLKTILSYSEPVYKEVSEIISKMLDDYYYSWALSVSPAKVIEYLETNDIYQKLRTIKQAIMKYQGLHRQATKYPSEETLREAIENKEPYIIRLIAQNIPDYLLEDEDILSLAEKEYPYGHEILKKAISRHK